MAPCEHWEWVLGKTARKPRSYGLIRASCRCASAFRASDDICDTLSAVYSVHSSSPGRGPVEQQHRLEECAAMHARAFPPFVVGHSGCRMVGVVLALALAWCSQ